MWLHAEVGALMRTTPDHPGILKHFERASWQTKQQTLQTVKSPLTANISRGEDCST